MKAQAELKEAKNTAKLAIKEIKETKSAVKAGN